MSPYLKASHANANRIVALARRGTVVKYHKTTAFMVIRREQLDSMARSLFFEKLRAFLRERVRRAELLPFMDDRRAMFSLWLDIGQRFELGSEYRAAIILAYAWFQVCSGLNPEQAVGGLLALDEAEYHAKCYFETSGILRFSEFDIALDCN